MIAMIWPPFLRLAGVLANGLANSSSKATAASKRKYLVMIFSP